MKRLSLLAALAVSFAPAAPLAADTVQGVLLDNVCLAKLESPAYDAALEHSATCRLVKDGKRKGFSVVQQDGSVVRLDARGASLALRAIDAGGKTSRIEIQAEGKRKGERVRVEKLMLIG